MRTCANDFPEFSPADDKITGEIKNLDWINYQIAELIARKQQSENRLQALLNHNPEHEGQIQYTHDRYAVTIRTGYNWSFDKKEYAIMESHIPKCFNPVTQKISYQLDRTVLDDIEKYASGDERNMLMKIFSKEPKKLNVSIKARK